MARADQLKEELAGSRLRLGGLSAAYLALMGGLVSFLMNLKPVVAPSDWFWLCLGMAALVAVTTNMVVVDLNMRKKLRELGAL